MFGSGMHAGLGFADLAKFYHYAVFFGNTYFLRQGLVSDTSLITYHSIGFANLNPGFKRSIITNWEYSLPRDSVTLGESSPYHIPAYAPYTFPNIWLNTLPDFNMTNDGLTPVTLTALGVTTPPGDTLYPNPSPVRISPDAITHTGIQDAIAWDGWAQRKYLKRLTDILVPSRLDIALENGEVLFNLRDDSLYYHSDITIFNDHTSFGYSFRRYNVYRNYETKLAYVTPWKNFLDSLNANTTVISWYNIGSSDDAQDYYSAENVYDPSRLILPLEGSYRRATTAYYPYGPSGWYQHPFGSYSGWTRMVCGVYHTRQWGDSLYQFVVSPGFHDNIAFTIDDASQIRPGQYLGILKGLAFLGSDTYNVFDYEVRAGFYPGANRIWKLVMPAYAQGILSHMQSFMYHGRVLEGDPRPGFDFCAVIIKPYQFNTGNNDELVVVRKEHGAERYAIMGSLQRWSPLTGASYTRAFTRFFLHEDGSAVIIDTLQFEIRRQGSTYIYDKTNPSAPVFYQLDGWHEWTDPYYWCHDFCVEAEVYDDSTTVGEIRTERPSGVTGGDFREFTSYVQAPGAAAWQYHILVRNPDQDSLFLWVRARSKGPGTTSLSVTWNAAPAGTITGITPGWNWYRMDAISGLPIAFRGLFHPCSYTLGLSTADSLLEIDRFVLLRSNANPFSTSLSTSITTSTDTICPHTPVSLYAGTTGLTGCASWFWDFGDGQWSYEATPVHQWAYPGTYHVLLIVDESCTGRSDTTLFTMTVTGPFAFAGEDRTACSVTFSLSGWDTLATTRIWYQRVFSDLYAPFDTSSLVAIASSLALPVFIDTTTTFVLVSSDGACTATDSVTFYVAAPLRLADSTVYVCRDSLLLFPPVSYTLTWTGAGFPEAVRWYPGSLVSDSTSLTTSILPTTADTTLFVLGWSLCSCDTDTAVIRIRTKTFPSGILTRDTTICSNNPIPVAAIMPPGGSVRWSPATWFSQPDSANTTVTVPFSSWLYCRFTDSAGCYRLDSVRVNIDDRLCCFHPTFAYDTLYKQTASGMVARFGTSTFTGMDFHVIDTLTIDTSLSFTSCRLFMSAHAVIQILHGDSLLLQSTVLRSACEDTLWNEIRLDDSTAYLSALACTFRDAETAVHAWWGGEVHLVQNIFNRNHIHIRLRRAPLAINPFYAAGNNFNGDTILYPPYLNTFPYYGIYADRCGTLTVGDSTGSQNIFRKSHCGLFMSGSTLNLYNNRFVKMRTAAFLPSAPNAIAVLMDDAQTGGRVWLYAGGDPLGNAVNLVDSCLFGISASRISAWVKGNRFVRCTQGMQWKSLTFDSLYVLENRLRNCETGVFVNGLNNFTRIQILKNKLSSPDSISNTSIKLTASVPTSASGQILVKWNIITAHQNGVWTLNIGSGEIISNTIRLRPYTGSGTYSGIRVENGTKNIVRENIISGPVTGLDTSKIGVNGISLFQSSNATLTCNDIRWVGEGVEFNGACNPVTLTFNQFRYMRHGIALYNTALTGNIGKPSAAADNRWLSGITRQRINVSSGNLTIPTSVYYKRPAGGAYSPNPQYPLTGAPGTAFPYDTAMGSVTPNTCSAPGSGGGGSSLRLLVQDSIMYPVRYSDASETNKRIVFKTYIQDSTLATDTVLSTFCDSAITGPIGQWHVLQRYLANDSIAHACGLISCIPTTGIHNGYLNTVLQIALASIYTGVDSFTASQITDLRYIAVLCPYLDGEAVWFARALLEYTDGPETAFISDCEYSPESKKDHSPETPLLQDCITFPNPVSDKLTIRCSYPMKGGLLRVYDHLGHIVSAFQVPTESGSWEIDTAHLPSAVYTLQFVFENGSSEYYRFTVAH